MENPCAAYGSVIARLREEGNLRSIPASASIRPGLIDLSSNDYLGLASRPELQAEFMDSPEARAIPLTSSASRLLCGVQEQYEALEEMLSGLYGRDALLFNSGYHANTGLVSALASLPGTLILADRLVHASIIDGITLSRAPFKRFRHNDISHLTSILDAESGKWQRILVITESVFSMDGDTAPLDSLAMLKQTHPEVMLYVDEAHAVGVEGDRGLGLCRSSASYPLFDVVVGTFGKACASMGAFAVTLPGLREYLLNRARSFIFSTALPPMQAAWTRFLLGKIIGMDAERAALRHLGAGLAERLGIPPSHILPVMTGDPVKAVTLSRKLLDERFKVLPIRVPTVPPGTDRLRISLSAALSEEDVSRFADTLLTLMDSQK